ncbi:MAG TPA: hypothetical protein VE548_01710 [Nitrososphaeraceae archaeon]|nr:hypothetical protein [Nitrososphaeraceae archaeon]
MQYQNHAVLSILTAVLITTITLTSVGSIYVTVQGQNMSGMVSEESYGNATTAPDKDEIYVRDSQAALLEERTIPSQGFIHLYDSTPFVITNGHIAANVPCEDNSTASLNVLIGQAPNLTNAQLENVPQLSNPGTMCLYHVDIPPQNLTVTDIAIQNPSDSDATLPAGSTVVIGVNEIMPGAEHHEEE